MDRLFLDANVLFSAAYRPSGRLATLWKVKAELITSEYAAGEAVRNAALCELVPALSVLLQSVALCHDIPAHGITPEIEMLPAKDRPILLAAMHSGATHLLTGDKKHFGMLFGKRIGTLVVITPGEYLRRTESA